MMRIDVDDDILDDEKNGPARVYRDRKLALQVLSVGLAVLRKERRRANRLALKAELPSMTETVTSVDGGGRRSFATLSSAGRQKMQKMTETWLGSRGWFIGSKNLMDFTRDELRQEMQNEMRSRDGHAANAAFYEALVTPMKRGDQTIGDYWLKVKPPHRPQPPSSPSVIAA